MADLELVGGGTLELLGGGSLELLLDDAVFASSPVPPGDVVVGGGGGVLGLSTPHVVYPNPEDAPGWSGRVVTMTGTLIAELPNISVQTVVDELNRPVTATFTMPKNDPAATSIELGADVQLWRNEQIMFWGPVIGARAGADVGPVNLDSADPMWVLGRRYFGTAERINKLDNGGFEGSIAPWAPVNVTAEHETTDPGLLLRGEGSVVLYAPTTDDAYITQTKVVETTWPYGQRLTVSAWCYISSFSWVGPSLQNRGLHIVRRTYPGGVVQAEATAEITAETPRDKWVRLEASYVVRPNELGTIEVRLYAVDGIVWWDEARMTEYESTSGDPAGNDQAELVRRIVSYAQTGRGKSSINLGTSTPATGVVKPLRAWQHADHQPIMEAVREFTDAADGLDVSVELTPVSRTFTTHFPFRGVDRTDLVLSTPENVATFGYSSDLGRTANSVVVLAASSGPSREEGGAIDSSTLSGLVLEDVIAANPDLPIGQLDTFAEEEMDSRKHPISVLEVLLKGPDLIGVLRTGDLVSVDFDDGFVQADGEWRVVRTEVNAAADQMRLSLNRWLS